MAVFTESLNFYVQYTAPLFNVVQPAGTASKRPRIEPALSFYSVAPEGSSTGPTTGQIWPLGLV